MYVSVPESAALKGGAPATYAGGLGAAGGGAGGTGGTGAATMTGAAGAAFVNVNTSLLPSFAPTGAGMLSGPGNPASACTRHA